MSSGIVAEDFGLPGLGGVVELAQAVDEGLFGGVEEAILGMAGVAEKLEADLGEEEGERPETLGSVARAGAVDAFGFLATVEGM